MSEKTRQRGGTWVCTLGGQDQTWVHGRPNTPALLELEAATLETKMRRLEAHDLQVRKQDVLLRLTLTVEELRALQLAAAKAIDTGEPFDNARLETASAKHTALQLELSAFERGYLRCSIFTVQELAPYYSFVLDHTLTVEGLPDEDAWEDLEHDARLEHLHRLNSGALMSYVDTITASAGLAYSKKKDTSTTSSPRSSTPASATSASARRTRKKRKRTEKSTDAKSRTSTKKSKR